MGGSTVMVGNPTVEYLIASHAGACFLFSGHETYEIDQKNGAVPESPPRLQPLCFLPQFRTVLEETPRGRFPIHAYFRSTNPERSG
jgi:hypothetical protein